MKHCSKCGTTAAMNDGMRCPLCGGGWMPGAPGRVMPARPAPAPVVDHWQPRSVPRAPWGWFALAAVVALLVATNPDHHTVIEWAMARAPVSQPESGAELIGQAAGVAMAPALMTHYMPRENYLVCSVFRTRLSGGAVLLGIAGQIVPLTEIPQPEVTPQPPPAYEFH